MDLDPCSLSQPMGSPLFDSPHVTATLHRNRNAEVPDTGAGSGRLSEGSQLDIPEESQLDVQDIGAMPSLPTSDTLLDIPEDSQLDFQDGQFPDAQLEVSTSDGSKASMEELSECEEEGPRASGVATPDAPRVERRGSWELSPGGSLPELSPWESREVLSNIDNGAIVVDTPHMAQEVESGDFWLTATCFSKGELYCLKFKTSSMKVRAASLKPVAQARDRTRSPPPGGWQNHRWWRHNHVAIVSDDESSQ